MKLFSGRDFAVASFFMFFLPQCVLAQVGANAVTTGPVWEYADRSDILAETTLEIGPEGGSMRLLGGTYTLTVPSEALAEPHVLLFQLRDARPEDGGVNAPVLQLTSDPPLTAPLNYPAILDLGSGYQEPNQVQLCALDSLPGRAFPTSDPNQPLALNFWKPAWTTRVSDSNHPVTPLTGFGTFSACLTPINYQAIGYKKEAIDANMPIADALVPGKTPEGYAYVGVMVVKDFVYQPQWSTVPLKREDLSSDLIKIDSKTVVEDGVTKHDYIVAHVYTPQVDTGPLTEPCVPKYVLFGKPDTPSGYIYVGRDVVINGEWDESRSTYPLERDPLPTDLVYLKSETKVQDQATECDIIVTHVFAEAPRTTATSSDCVPNESMLEQPYAAPNGYVYLGRDVVINGQYDEGLSNMPLDRPFTPSDMVSVRSTSDYHNGVVTCDIIVAHTFARIDGQGNAPSYQELSRPETPEGHVYVGRDVVIDGQWSETYSTVPLEREETPQDLNYMRSSTTMKDTVVTRDVVVRHLFVPIEYGGFSLDSALLERPLVPPCHRYVGYNVVVNGQLVSWTVPLERPFKATDLVYIHSETKVADKVTESDIIIAHVFEPVPCPPKVTTISLVGSAFAYNFGNVTEVYISPETPLSAADLEAIKALAISEPYIGSSGSVSVHMPLGTTIEHVDNQLIITLPDGYGQ